MLQEVISLISNVALQQIKELAALTKPETYRHFQIFVLFEIHAELKINNSSYCCLGLFSVTRLITGFWVSRSRGFAASTNTVVIGWDTV